MGISKQLGLLGKTNSPSVKMITDVRELNASSMTKRWTEVARFRGRTMNDERWMIDKEINRLQHVFS